jgi:hypothetical protein
MVALSLWLPGAPRLTIPPDPPGPQQPPGPPPPAPPMPVPEPPPAPEPPDQPPPARPNIDQMPKPGSGSTVELRRVRSECGVACSWPSASTGLAAGPRPGRPASIWLKQMEAIVVAFSSRR